MPAQRKDTAAIIKVCKDGMPMDEIYNKFPNIPKNTIRNILRKNCMDELNLSVAKSIDKEISIYEKRNEEMVELRIKGMSVKDIAKKFELATADYVYKIMRHSKKYKQYMKNRK